MHQSSEKVSALTVVSGVNTCYEQTVTAAFDSSE